MAGMYCLTDLLDLAVRESAQELRLQQGKPPVIIVHDQTRTLDLPELTADNVADLFSSFATPEQTEELRRCGEIHFTCTSPHSGRFVVNASSGRQDFTLSIRPL
jgi:Tfp pilus assembly pilus retraction ATPase PilT